MHFKEKFSAAFEKLKNGDAQYRTFGSNSHNYALRPTLSVKEIEIFEKKYDCSLPASYRIFLTEFGNGGAGPSYGIFSLEQMDSGHEEDTWPDYIKPGASFRFTSEYNNADILHEGEPDQDDFEDEDEYYDACDAWADEFGEERYEQYYEAHALDGAIPICHHGCALRSWLVTDENSPEFGNIWEDMVAEDGGVAPTLNADGERMTFGEWMLDWCKKSLQV